MKLLAGNPYLKQEGEKFFFDKIEYSDLEKQFETPYYIFLENRIRDNVRVFNKVFSSHFENFQGFYSFKANYLSEICDIIKEEGFGAEVISVPELNLALKLNFPPNKIIAGGLYLTDEFIIKCFDNKIKEIVVYSLEDIKRIEQLAKKSNAVQNICIRVNSGKYDARLGLYPSDESINELREILSNCEHLTLTTILSHFSTQMNSVKLLKKHCTALLETLKKIEKSPNININNINFGGGFPEAVVFKEQRLEELASVIEKLLQIYNFPNLKVYFEPGRYLVGDAGILISKVINVQENNWIFVNVGNHIVPKFARAHLRFYNLSNYTETYNQQTSIAGIIPSDQDVLIKDYFFTPTVKVGDKLLITNVGAYCLTFSNRFPYKLPEILLVTGNDFKTIFDPDKNKDFSLS